MAESKWTVTERTTRDELPMAVPIEPRHICVLFRRFLHFGDDVTRPYVDALEARGVPHLLVGGKSFHDREEVETIRAALAAIEWPDDELSVFATLRGGLFALDDDTLAEYRQRYKTVHPFRAPPLPAGAETTYRSSTNLFFGLLSHSATFWSGRTATRTARVLMNSPTIDSAPGRAAGSTTVMMARDLRLPSA